jgi:hypothetical protein
MLGDAQWGSTKQDQREFLLSELSTAIWATNNGFGDVQPSRAERGPGDNVVDLYFGQKVFRFFLTFHNAAELLAMKSEVEFEPDAATTILWREDLD